MLVYVQPHLVHLVNFMLNRGCVSVPAIVFHVCLLLEEERARTSEKRTFDVCFGGLGWWSGVLGLAFLLLGVF